MSAFLAPAGSTPVASAHDMGRYLQAWLAPAEGGVVTPWAAERATEPLVAQGPEHYGLGLVVAACGAGRARAATRSCGCAPAS